MSDRLPGFGYWTAGGIILNNVGKSIFTKHLYLVSAKLTSQNRLLKTALSGLRGRLGGAYHFGQENPHAQYFRTIAHIP